MSGRKGSRSLNSGGGGDGGTEGTQTARLESLAVQRQLDNSESKAKTSQCLLILADSLVL